VLVPCYRMPVTSIDLPARTAEKLPFRTCNAEGSPDRGTPDY
jgi:hypothetical protein